MQLQLRISDKHYQSLKKHLFPGDGKEAVAVALCGRHSHNKRLLLVHDLTLIPYNECNREPDLITWSTSSILKYFEIISKKDWGIVKFHSHPANYGSFSLTDDKSDLEFFESVFGWTDNDNPHASCIMLPDGSIFGRAFYPNLTHAPLHKISLVGSEIISFSKTTNTSNNDFAQRTIQAFGERTFSELQKMRIGVIGCSGTGSPLIEQLVRLGIGELVLVDPDTVELKNLNRILNSSKQDAISSKPKVDVIRKAIEGIGLGTIVQCFQSNLYNDINALRALIECDIIFGCVDSVDGRFLLNQLCSFYLIPYFDLGVKLEADGKGGISKICCSVHYIQPGKSSLMSRGIYTIEDLKAAGQYRKNSDEYQNLKKNGYIKNINVNSPAVISINMQIASHAINEFLNRIHRYKGDPSENYACSTIDITENYIINLSESSFPEDDFLTKKVGRGDMLPFLEIPEIHGK